MENQKTIKEWLEELEEPYRSQALKNLKEGRSPVVSKVMVCSLSEALHGAFFYLNTKEGHQYWYSKLKQLRSEGK